MMNNLVARLRAPSITNRPPGRAEVLRNDLAVLVALLIALLLGLGIREQARKAHRSYDLGDGLPKIWYPAGWLSGQPGFLHFQASNPASPSSYDARVDVILRDRKPEETLDLARANWGLQRSQDLLLYREFDSTPATVLDGQPALLTRYAYVADPTRDSGASGLPVVVEGEDLLFFADNKLVVATVSADANHWEVETRHFQLVFDSLKMQPVTVEADQLLSTPPATSTTPAEGGSQ